MLKNKLSPNSIKSIIECLKIEADENLVTFFEYPNKTDKYDLPYCHSLSLKIKGVKYKSWGTGYTKDEAALKCIAELLERIALKNSIPEEYFAEICFYKRKFSISQIQNQYPEAKNWIGTTSSGIAIHSSYKKAKNSALNELIERHVILKAISNNIHPCKNNGPSIVKDYVLPSNLTSNYYYWVGPLSRKVVLNHIKIDNLGSLYSFGCDKALEKALEKAFIESVGMMIFANSIKNNVNIKEDHKSKIDIKAIRNYHLYSDDESIHRFLYSASTLPVYVDTKLQNKHFYYTILNMPEYLKNIVSLVALKCVSPLTQPLFFDYWKKEHINPMAIDLTSNELPRGIHVIT